MLATPLAAVAMPGREPARRSGMAIASLILGIVGIVFPVILPILAVVFGIIGLRQARDPQVTGKGMAIAGLTLGSVGTCLFAVVVISVLFAPDKPHHGQLSSDQRASATSQNAQMESRRQQSPPAVSYSSDSSHHAVAPPDGPLTSRTNTHEAPDVQLGHDSPTKTTQVVSRQQPVSSQPTANTVETSRRKSVVSVDRDTVFMGVVITWGIISLIGLIAGCTGHLVVFANWLDVLLTAAAILIVAMSWQAYNNADAPPGSPAASVAGTLTVTILAGLVLGLRSWFSNRSILRTIVAVPTKVTTIALLLVTLLFTIGSFLAFRDAKTKSRKQEQAVNTAVGAVGTGALAYLIGKLIGQSAQWREQRELEAIVAEMDEELAAGPEA